MLYISATFVSIFRQLIREHTNGTKHAYQTVSPGIPVLLQKIHIKSHNVIPYNANNTVRVLFFFFSLVFYSLYPLLPFYRFTF